MANLAITSVCNRRCGYCFAKQGTAAPPPVRHMPPETFRRSLTLLQRAGLDQARLLGGEPSLHPQFDRFVDEVMTRRLSLLVFSNGLMPERALRALEGPESDRVRVLVNVTDLEELRPAQRAHQGRVLERLGRKAMLGITISSTATVLEHLVPLIRQYGLRPAVRLGIALPLPGTGNQFLPPRRYRAVGLRLVSLLSSARTAGVEVTLDCGFVPCMFGEEARAALGEELSRAGPRCMPLQDILPDGTVAPCFPVAQWVPWRFPLEDAGPRARREIERRLAPYREVGIFQWCSGCGERRLGRCRGGCRAAAMRRVHRGGEPGPTLTLKRLAPLAASPHLSVAPAPAPAASTSSAPSLVVPYIDQPVSFWEGLAERFPGRIREVYVPLPPRVLGSGRPAQPDRFLEAFLGRSPFAISALLNPLVLPGPVEAIAPRVIEALRRLVGEHGLKGITVANLTLAAVVREALPSLMITASTLMGIAHPDQALMLEGICDALVPATAILRDRPALRALREAFPGRIRLLVNEGCLPGCPWRAQHFSEMSGGEPTPRSLCTDLLRRRPWMRLTGAWVLPQHLRLYDGLYDDLKLAGRVTLRRPDDYRRVLAAYAEGQPLGPHQIGAGPAAPQQPIAVDEGFFEHTLTCGRRCHACDRCRTVHLCAAEGGAAGDLAAPAEVAIR